MRSRSRKLSLTDRKIIEDLIHENVSKTKIAEVIDVSKTTIFRELKKCKGSYNAEEAQSNSHQSKNLIDWSIIGKRFGMLTVQKYANKYNHRTWWSCKCDCGGSIIVSRKQLADYCSIKRPLSCGCIAKQAGNNLKKMPEEESFLCKYQDLMRFRRIEGDCWIWTGYIRGKIPMCSWKNKVMSVRKCIYLLVNNTTYEPNPIYCTCGNLSCFNPEHLSFERPARGRYDV